MIGWSAVMTLFMASSVWAFVLARQPYKPVEGVEDAEHFYKPGEVVLPPKPSKKTETAAEGGGGHGAAKPASKDAHGKSAPKDGHAKAPAKKDDKKKDAGHH